MKKPAKDALWRAPFRFRRFAKKGSLLIVALWVVLLLGYFSIAAGESVRQKVAFAQRIDVQNTLASAAQAGVLQAMGELVEGPEGGTQDEYDSLTEAWANSEKAFNRISTGSAFYTVSYSFTNPLDGAEQIRFGARDEESKLNINKADAKRIATFLKLKIQDLSEEDAGIIAYSIVDWRDKDILLSHPDYGAEEDYYEGLKAPYHPKNAPFEVYEELLLARGVTREIYDAIINDVTIFGSGSVNANTAPKALFLTLGLKAGLVEKILSYRAGPDRMEGTTDDFVFYAPNAIAASVSQVYPLNDSETAAINTQVEAGALVTKSSHFMVHSIGELPNGWNLELTVVFERTEGKIRYWRAGLPRRGPAMKTS